MMSDDRSRILCENTIMVRDTSSKKKPGVVGPIRSLSIIPSDTKRVRAAKTATETTDWPTSTDVWCWWCCHAFDGVPIPLPLNYEERTDVFDVSGTFCCWGCVKAYNHAHTGYRRGIVQNLITLLHKRLMGRLDRIRSSPPRSALAVFGGSLSIEEFRNVPANQTYSILPQNMLLRLPNMIRFDPKDVADAGAQDASVDFDRAATKSEPLKLKRTKPMANHKNTLERVMGVSINKMMVSDHMRKSFDRAS